MCRSMFDITFPTQELLSKINTIGGVNKRDWFDYITLIIAITGAVLGSLTVYFQFFKKPKVLTIDKVSCNDGFVGSFMSFVITNHTEQDIVCYRIVLTLHYKNKKPNSFEVSKDTNLGFTGLDYLPYTIPSGQELESGCEDILNDTWSDVNKLVIAIYGIDNKVIDRKTFKGRALKKTVKEIHRQVKLKKQHENRN
jgi:hypothetical protein